MSKSIIEEDLKSITSSNLPWDRFENKTILISGANGFLPAYMAKSLLYLNAIKNKNIKVLGLVRNLEKAINQFSNHFKSGNLQLKLQNICEPLSIKDDVDYIIHAASQASPKFYRDDPVGTLCANSIGTYNLLNFAKKKEVEAFLFFSSSEIYGQVDQSEIPTNENCCGHINPTDLRSCYAESKRMGETMCVAWSHQYGVPAKIVRPFHTYGPGMNLKDGRVYADFIADFLQSRDIIVKSDGKATRAFCYLSDAVLGFFTVILKGEKSQAYNIGNDKCEIDMSSFASLISELYPQKKLNVIITGKSEDEGRYLKSKISRSCPDISKARALGWEPKYNLEKGLIRTIKWFAEENLAPMDDNL